VEEYDILKQMENRIPELPIIVHSFTPDFTRGPGILDTLVFVEKGGKSIEKLKEIITEMLHEANP